MWTIEYRETDGTKRILEECSADDVAEIMERLSGTDATEISVYRPEPEDLDSYEITYDYDDEWCGTVTTREPYHGTWDGLQDYLGQIKRSGCYNISAEYVGP